MKYTIPTLILYLMFVSLANAQSIQRERLRDWEFKFFACENVLLNASIVLGIMEKKNLSGHEGLDEIQVIIERTVALAVVENEKGFSFSKDEAAFITDVTFATLHGILDGGFSLTDTSVIRVGHNACVYAIDKIARK